MPVNVVDQYQLVMDGTVDNSAKLAKWAKDVVDIAADPKRWQPRYVWTEGECAFDEWPDFVVPDHLNMVADGQCVLKRMTRGDAVTLKGTANNNTWQVTFDGFTVVPMKEGNGLVTKQLHDSTIKVNVPGALPGYACIYVWFSVLTDFFPHVIGQEFYRWGTPEQRRATWGIVFDAMTGAGNGQTSKCTIQRPNISTCDTGILFKDAGMCDVMSGSAEGCGTGMRIIAGGNNHVMFTDFEMNSTADIVLESDAHDNFILWRTTQSTKKSVNKNLTNSFVPSLASRLLNL